jgi:hypothetical protein
LTTIDHRLDEAAGYLHLAAAAAERPANDNPAPELRTIAALARATAALISATPAQQEIEAGIASSLSAALDALESIGPGDGPADLPLLEWHVHDLCRVAGQAQP